MTTMEDDPCVISDSENESEEEAEATSPCSGACIRSVCHVLQKAMGKCPGHLAAISLPFNHKQYCRIAGEQMRGLLAAKRRKEMPPAKTSSMEDASQPNAQLVSLSAPTKACSGGKRRPTPEPCSTAGKALVLPLY